MSPADYVPIPVSHLPQLDGTGIICDIFTTTCVGLFNYVFIVASFRWIVVDDDRLVRAVTRRLRHRRAHRLDLWTCRGQ